MAIEVVQMIAFHWMERAEDVVALALSSKTVYGKVFGVLGEENAYDRDQHRAVAGIEYCMQQGWWRGARLAVERGYGDPSIEVDVGFVPAHPLTVASGMGEVELVRTLLRHPGVDPGVGNNRAMKRAARAGRVEVVRLLLQDDRAHPAEEGDNYAIELAAHYGHTEVVELLLGDPRVDPCGNNNYCIRYAAREGHVDIVRLLLGDPRVDPAGEESQALCGAVEMGHIDVAKLLLEDGRVDPSASDDTPIRWAIDREDTEMTFLLLRHEMFDEETRDLDVIVWAASWTACETGQVLKALLEDESLYDTLDWGSFGYALSVACLEGSVNVVSLLLEDTHKRADPCYGDNEPLAGAILNGHIIIVGLLLKDGRVDRGVALELAEQHGCYERVKALVDSLPLVVE